MSTKIATSLEFNVVDHATKAVREIGKEIGDLLKSSRALGTVTGGVFLGTTMADLAGKATAQVRDLARSFVDAAGRADELRSQIQVFERGNTAAVFQQLRVAAMGLPVSLEAATNAFTTLRTAGIQPARKDLEALANLAGNLSGNANSNIASLASTLATITTRGASGEGLNRALLQLQNQGLPVLDILRDKLGVAAADFDSLGKAGVSAGNVVEAMFSYMRDQAKDAADDWGDLKQKAANVWHELQIQVMEAGPFQAMKDGLKEFTDYLNTEKGKLDIRRLMLDVADGVVVAFEAMTKAAEGLYRAWYNVTGLMKGVAFLSADAKVGEYEARAKVLQEDILTGEKWQRLETTGDRAKWIASGKGYFSADAIVEKRRELAELDSYLKYLRQYQEDTARAFGAVNMPGEQTPAGKALAGIRASLANARERLVAGAGATTTTAGALAGGMAPKTILPESAYTVAEADKAWAREVDAALKAAEKTLKVRQDLTDEVNRLTMTESEYKRAALDREVDGLRAFAAESQRNADLVTAYRIAKLDEIARAEEKSARDVAEQIAAIRREAAVPLGRFDQARADIDTAHQDALRSLEEQVANRSRTPAQAREIQDALDAARGAKLAEVNRQASNDYAAGWGEGLRQVMDEMQSGFERMTSLAKDTAQAMQQSFGDFFFDAMQGKLESFSDYMESFLTSIQRSLANMMGQMATQQIIGAATSAFGGMFGGGAATLPSYTGANGAVWRGGFTPFAGGGIVNRPTLGLVGEGRYTEAIVPLPDGRSIPAKVVGAQQPMTIKVELHNESGTELEATSGEARFDGQQYILDVWIDGFRRNRSGLRTMLAGGNA